MDKLTTNSFKKRFYFVIVLSSFGAFGQQDLERIEIDYIPSTKTKEFTILLNDISEEFEWSGKKIAYVTGSLGQQIVNQKTYFQIIHQWPDSIVRKQLRIHVLTEEEKESSGGYDAIISFFVKRFSKSEKKK